MTKEPNEGLGNHHPQQVAWQDNYESNYRVPRRNLLLVTYKAFYYLDVDRNEWNAEKIVKEIIEFVEIS